MPATVQFQTRIYSRVSSCWRIDSKGATSLTRLVRI